MSGIGVMVGFALAGVLLIILISSSSTDARLRRRRRRAHAKLLSSAHKPNVKFSAKADRNNAG